LVQLQAEKIPQAIAQFERGTNLPSKNYAILSSSLLGSRIVEICLLSFTAKIAQFLLARAA